jgi:hypothetical protein
MGFRVPSYQPTRKPVSGRVVPPPLGTAGSWTREAEGTEEHHPSSVRSPTARGGTALRLHPERYGGSGTGRRQGRTRPRSRPRVARSGRVRAGHARSKHRNTDSGRYTY